MRGGSCVDGPRLARDNFACRTEVACSHVSGLFTQSGWTAGPDRVREPRPHHSSGIDVPMNRQVSLGCVGSTDCAITRHYSLPSFAVIANTIVLNSRLTVRIFIRISRRFPANLTGSRSGPSLATPPVTPLSH